MFIEWASFALVGAAALALGAGLASHTRLRVVRQLVIAGALLRIVGVLARYTMIFDLYGGGSDAVGYFGAGRAIAAQLHALDFSFIGSGQWGDRQWGTQAVRYAAGLVVGLVGPSMRGAFLVFSLGAFVGLVCMAIAFGRATPSGSVRRSVLLLFFWPTLWFWPSSLGKEALLLLAIGLTTLGYVGRRERVQWLPMLGGLALALAIRPHLGGVLAVSIGVAEWTARGWSPRRLLQTALVSALAVWLLTVALGMLGLESADPQELESFVRQTSEQTNQGGSAFARTGSLAAGVPMAFVNILARPFITEARTPMALASSLEMLAFWALVLGSRRRLGGVLRSWRANRLLRFAVPFALLYVLMIGLSFQNLGIIARQRTLVMPALLLLLAAVPAGAVQQARARLPYRRVWATPGPAPSASPWRRERP